MSQIIPVPVQLNVETNSEQYALSVSEQNIPISFQIGTAIVADTTRTYGGPYSVTPTEEQQTLQTANLKMTDDVTVGAIPSDYVGPDVPREHAADVTVSGSSVAAPAGYYEEPVTKSVQSGSVSVPSTSITANPSLTITQNTGRIESSVSASQSIDPSVSEGYVTSGASGTVSVSGSNHYDLPTQAAATITPSETAQTAVSAHKWTTGAVDVAAIPSDYVGSSIARNDSSDLTSSGATVTVQAGYYESNASASVQSATWKSASTVGVVPEITVSSSGLITANCAGWTSHKPLSVSGYADADTSANIQLAGVKTSQLDTVAATTYTPNKVSTQEIPAGKYTTGIQTIGKIPEEYIVPSGTKSITSNGTGIDVTSYASVDVAVPSQSATLQSKTKSYTPSETAQSETVSADAGYDGLSSVGVSVGAISSTYVGSGIDRRDSTNLSASGATVSVPKGFYENNASKSVSSGSATAPASISGSSASVSTGTNTLTLSKTVSVTPSVTAGYVSSGTAGNSSVSLTASVTTQGAQTIHPSTNDQTIGNGRYLTGTQTVKAVTLSNLTADNIKSGVIVKVGDSTDDDCVTSVTGTYTGGGTGMNKQIYYGPANVKNNGYIASSATLTVATTGTYKVSWTAWRSSSSGTMGTNLHKNTTAGTNQQTFTGTYGQCITLTNQSYTAGDVLTIYATSGSTSRTIYIANFVIEQTA